MANSTVGDKSFKGAANLVKLLPSGTVFIFHFLSPLLTNKGKCTAINKYSTIALLVLCSSSCCFSSFTDSYTSDGKVYYGVVTFNGLCTFASSGSELKKDLSRYKLRFGDFVHLLLSLLVFGAVAVLNPNILDCFYPSIGSEYRTAVIALPAVIGGLSSFVFMVLPNTRHGIGYAATPEPWEDTNHESRTVVRLYFSSKNGRVFRHPRLGCAYVEDYS